MRSSVRSRLAPPDGLIADEALGQEEGSWISEFAFARVRRLMRAVCHREEETYPIVYRAEVWSTAFVRRIRLRERSRRRAASCEQSLTAMFSDMFEANGLSITPA